jgi:outer membrane immunogenic protein
MRKFIGAAGVLWSVLAMSTAADAADLPVAPAPVYVPPAFFTWTGFYAGGNIGGAWDRGRWSESLFAMNLSAGATPGQFIGGGQAGFNYQIGRFVAGLEGDFDWTANNPNTTGNDVFIPPVGHIQVVSSNRWIATAAARFGFAFGHVYYYAKAGGGWVGNNGVVVNNLTTGTAIAGATSSTNTGWLAGAGVEWAVTDNWSVKIEYDFLGLSGQSFAIPTTAPFLAGDTFSNSSHNIQMAKIGVNYLFNWGGPAAGL